MKRLILILMRPALCVFRGIFVRFRGPLLLHVLIIVGLLLSDVAATPLVAMGRETRPTAVEALTKAREDSAPTSKRAKRVQDRRQDRRQNAEQKRNKDRTQADRKQDRKQDRKRKNRNQSRPESAGQLCEEAGAIWQPEINQCSHGPDPAPPGFAINKPVAPLAKTTTQDAAAAFACDGDGTSGYRVQVLYVYPNTMASRYAIYLPSFLAWTADMDRIFQDSAAETGGSRRLRFVHDNTCTPTVTPVSVPAATIGGWSTLNAELQRQGFNSLQRIYLMYVDASTYCGFGSWWNDDRPDPNLNYHNYGQSYARVDTGCWGGSTAAHEVMHNLGGVQNSSPHTTFDPANPVVYSGGHCIDEWDVMCYSDVDQSTNRPPMTFPCGPQGRDNARFDCNHDDYYHTNPPSGSYLATRWNPANNRFLIAGPNSGAPPPVVDTVAPDVTWNAPIGNGQTIQASSGVIELKLTASDNDRVERVKFWRYDDARKQWVDIATDLTAPYTASVDVANLQDGFNEISAGAADPVRNWRYASIFIERVAGTPPPVVSPPPPPADTSPPPDVQKKKKKKKKKKKR